MTAKLTDYNFAAEFETTEIEQYQHDTKTVIIEWDDETRTIHGFDEADHMYTGKSIDECAAELHLTADEMNGLINSDVTYLERK